MILNEIAAALPGPSINEAQQQGIAHVQQALTNLGLINLEQGTGGYAESKKPGYTFVEIYLNESLVATVFSNGVAGSGVDKIAAAIDQVTGANPYQR
tara:strand:+ start:170 stop:460 length:291 start_codon:yes stop_codon:yes gene_type:complete